MLVAQVQTDSATLQQLVWKEAKILKILFTIIATNVNSAGNANPYVAGGDTLDLTQLFVAAGLNVPSRSLPVKIELQSARPKGAADSAALFQYEFAVGTTLANGTMQVFTGAAAQSGLAELNAGNYPAGVLDDTIQGEVYFVVD